MTKQKKSLDFKFKKVDETRYVVKENKKKFA